MAFWKNNMPVGMLLRSKDEASNIAAPQKHLSIFAYAKSRGRKIPDPVPIEDFVAYGDWFQKQVAPGLDTRQVKDVRQENGLFELTMEDGERLQSKSVVVALGIGPFFYRPEAFADIPRELAPHSSDFNEFSRFKGKRVAVLGRGQSSLESAALLHENGANVEIFTRDPALIYRPYAWRKYIFRAMTSGPLLPFSYKVMPPTDLGDVWTSRKMAHPELFRKQSPEMQLKLLRMCARPIGAYWLEPRLKNVPVHTNVSVKSAARNGSKLNVTFSDGKTEEFDFVVCATGYHIDVSKYSIFENSLQQRIKKTAEGYPVLDTNLQTTVSGLYMAGVIGEKTLGPTLRFVTGTSNAGPRIAAGIVGSRTSSNAMASA
jgi:thioredoxin reductase